jgi:hypothetical protein
MGLWAYGFKHRMRPTAELKERARENVITVSSISSNSYNPSDNETFILSSTESLMYPSLADSLTHLPWRLNNLSDKPLFAAAVAPPDLRECKPNV